MQSETGDCDRSGREPILGRSVRTAQQDAFLVLAVSQYAVRDPGQDLQAHEELCVRAVGTPGTASNDAGGPGPGTHFVAANISDDFFLFDLIVQLQVPNLLTRWLGTCRAAVQDANTVPAHPERGAVHDASSARYCAPSGDHRPCRCA